MRNFDILILNLGKELKRVGKIDSLVMKHKQVGEVLKCTPNSISIHISRNTLPLKQVVKVSLENGLDLNAVFKDINIK